MDSETEKKSLRYTLGTLGLLGIVGGAMIYFDQEINDLGKKIIAAYHTTRPLTSTEVHNLSNPQVKISEKRTKFDRRACLNIGLRGTAFMDTQTTEIYVLTEKLFCLSQSYSHSQLEIKVGTFPATIEKDDKSLGLTLLRVENCYNCLPHFNGKIAFSTKVGETFLYNESGKSATGTITYKGIKATWDNIRYDLTDQATRGSSAVVIEDGKPCFIGLAMEYESGIGFLNPIESIRSFIKGTALEDELLY